MLFSFDSEKFLPPSVSLFHEFLDTLFLTGGFSYREDVERFYVLFSQPIVFLDEDSYRDLSMISSLWKSANPIPRS